jgi:hypothetical protein
MPRPWPVAITDTAEGAWTSSPAPVEYEKGRLWAPFLVRSTSQVGKVEKPEMVQDEHQNPGF